MCSRNPITCVCSLSHCKEYQLRHIADSVLTFQRVIQPFKIVLQYAKKFINLVNLNFSAGDWKVNSCPALKVTLYNPLNEDVRNNNPLPPVQGVIREP